MTGLSLGCSIYTSYDQYQVDEFLRVAKKIGMKYVFTSLHIPEESQEVLSFLEQLLQKAHNMGFEVIADISPFSLKRLGISHLEDLFKWNVDWWRVDYGFDIDEIIKLHDKSGIMMNASLLDRTFLKEVIKRTQTTQRLAACHNFYPKPLSGMSVEYIKHQNEICHDFGIPVFGFIAGDGQKRGPIGKGLPTVEDTREVRPMHAALQLWKECKCDGVLIGDPSCSFQSQLELMCLSQNMIPLRVKLRLHEERWYNQIQQERIDSSPYVIRSITSRPYALSGMEVPSRPSSKSRKAGSIWQANHEYKRYSGEIEIARVDLPADPWQNEIGEVCQEDIGLLPYVRAGLQYFFVPMSKRRTSKSKIIQGSLVNHHELLSSI